MPPLTFLILLLASILVFPIASSNLEFLKCLQRSNPVFNQLIFTPRNASYQSLLRTQNLRPASTFPERPLLIFTPLRHSHIQAAIRCSRVTGLQIRVRSGGHDYEGLSYISTYMSKNPFVVIDLRNLQSIDVDADRKTAWVEVGATLGQLYYTVAQKSKTLAFPAGVCPTVGVGGHFSGGGYGMISRKHSIASDHIIDAKVIDADGRILDRRSMGEDLFWAMRGGGGTSFGIVVAYKVELVVVPETVTVFNVTRTLEQNATQLVHRWQYVADRVDDRLLLRLFLSSIRSPTGTGRTIAASFTTLFLGGVRDLLPIMEEKFPELGLEEEDCTEMSWIESTLVFAELSGQPLEILLNRTASTEFHFKAKSDYVQEPIPVDGLMGIWRFLHREAENDAQLQFSPYGGVINTYSESETPFPHRSGNIFMIHYVVFWQRPAEAQRHLNWIRSLYKYTAQYVSKSPRAAYYNYRDLDIGVNNEGNTSFTQASSWGYKYFKNNFKRLARVKTKVDPSNFFRNEQSIPPLTLW